MALIPDLHGRFSHIEHAGDEFVERPSERQCRNSASQVESFRNFVSGAPSELRLPA
jgi:hypothetical protein